MRLAKNILWLVLAIAMGSSLASADVIATFDLSGTYTNGDAFALHFESPATPTPIDYSSGQYFDAWVSGTETINGVSTSFTNEDFTFYNSSWGGLVAGSTPSGFWSLYGMQLYTGDESAPTFIDVFDWQVNLAQSSGPEGTFASAVGYSDPPTTGPDTFTAVPEPSTLAFLGAALGLWAPIRRRFGS